MQEAHHVPRPAQSLEPPWGRVAVFSDAATEQDLCKIVIATRTVNLATTSDYVPKAGVVGCAGLLPTVAAIEAGKVFLATLFCFV